MKILLTGGAGFIGSSIAEVLLDNDHDLVILDNLNNSYSQDIKENNLREIRNHGNFIFSQIDIRDQESLSRLFRKFQPEKVIHLAAMAGVRPSLLNPILYSDININGTINLLELSRQHSVEQFIFASSSSVYGANTKTPFSEKDTLDNICSPYAATKLTGENLCSVFSRNYQLRTTSLRFFTVFGPRQRPDMAIHKFVRLISLGQTIPVYHDGVSARDYTYISDIVQGILASLNHQQIFDVFNLGNSKTTSLLDLIRIIEGSLGKKAIIEYLPQQEGDVPLTYADISKARTELAYNPKTGIEEGINNFIEWYRKQDLTSY
jgi:UDP-glucuronate 4-epimerase